MPSSTVAVQDPRRLFREGLALVLGRDPAVDEVLTAATVAELVDLAHEHKPDVVVLPVDGEGDDQREALRAVDELAVLAPVTRVIGLHGGLQGAMVRRLARAGATLVARDDGAAGIVAAIRGDAPSCESSAADADTDTDGDVSPLLTTREVDVLRLVASGLTTKEISGRLGISPKTVENHKQRSFWKLGVQSQAHAVAVAMREGLLSLADATDAAGRDAG